MRRVFHNPWGEKERWVLRTADLSEQAKPLSNPARGWYQIYTFQAEEEPDLRELAYCLDVHQTLALVFLDIGFYRDRDLDSDCLRRMRGILRFFADHHKDMILRVAYDHQGRAQEREPFAFEQVIRHMEQVGALLAEFPHEIVVWQGLLVGNWGEMHTSRFLSEEKLGRLLEILYRCKSPHTYAAVRSPLYHRMLRGEKLGGMGLFDDGIFGSGSDLGTFGTYTKEAAGWGEAWVREEELAFEEEVCRRTLNGGEAVYGEDYTEGLSGERMIDDLRRMHIAYLNSRYDTRILDLWKNRSFDGPGPWAGRSLYEYIGAHMGYRFRVRSAGMVPAGGARRGLYRVELEIENCGFGNLCQEAELYLEWTGADGRFQRQRLACDLRELCGVQSADCVVQGCECTLYLAARRKWDGAPIRFANVSDEAGRTILGSLCRQTP
ncbi:MAG: DUF4874 domain-containing protein [Candidatus Gastranaerophilales bacterium]|nr:DUF4874 domain-containing protein [Candidatus Gastranaerophilales bacterium]